MSKVDEAIYSLEQLNKNGLMSGEMYSEEDRYYEDIEEYLNTIKQALEDKDREIENQNFKISGLLLNSRISKYKLDRIENIAKRLNIVLDNFILDNTMLENQQLVLSKDDVLHIKRLIKQILKED